MLLLMLTKQPDDIDSPVHEQAAPRQLAASAAHAQVVCHVTQSLRADHLHSWHVSHRLQ